MKKKLLSILFLMVMCMALLAGCDQPGSSSKSSSGSGSGSSSSGGDSKKTVGISMPTKSLERWNRDGAYLKKQFEKAGYNVEMTYSDNKTDQQVNDIQNLVSKNVDLLIVAAIDGEALTTCLDDAAGANIPVIAYDRLIRNTDAISYYVSFDNYKVGQLQGQYIVDTLDLDNAGSKTYNMEVTAGDPADNNAKFFYNGAMDVLQKYIDKGTIKVPSKQTTFEKCGTKQWNTATALDRMQNILASYYADGKTNLDICLCSNDSTALGVTQAVESDYKGKTKPLITGQDCDEENLKNILDGKQSMSVYKAVANEAIVTLDLSKEILAGKKPADDLCSSFDFETKYDTESYDNGKKVVPSYLLTPTVVTKDNYKKELVEPGYYKEDADGYLKATA